MAREAGLRRSTARGLVLAASLETLVGALLFFVPVALHRGDGLTTIAFAVGSAALVGVAFLSLMRVWPAGADIGFAVLATLAFGAGVGYATGLSPFVVCALAAVVIVHASPPARRHAIRRVLAEWERPVVAVLLVITGALLTLPTAWILLAVPFLAAARAAATSRAGPKVRREQVEDSIKELELRQKKLKNVPLQLRISQAGTFL